MTGITGITYVYNAIERDYCLEACIRSMLPICDEVIVADCGSNDGTTDLIDRLGVKRITLPFDLKTQGARWLLKCINLARMQARSPFILQLDADECIHEKDYGKITEQVFTGRPCWQWRHNFWMTSTKVLPEGKIVGNQIVRLAPTYYWMPSDEPRVPECPIKVDAIKPKVPDMINVFHYGFIRKVEAFVIKGKEMTEGYNGQADARIDKLLEQGREAFGQFVDPKLLLNFNGTHPREIQRWLQERGHPA